MNENKIIYIDYADDVICHTYLVQAGNEVYMINACGNQRAIENYLYNHLHCNDIKWIKSYLINDRSAIRLGRRNKIIARNAFLLSMEFVNYGWIRRKREK